MAFNLGVTEFISRPFDNEIVQRRVINTIMLYAKQKELIDLVAVRPYGKECQTATMSISLEAEQKKLKANAPKLETGARKCQIATEGLRRFIDKAKTVTQLTALTPELVHEFIQKIVAGKSERRDGKRYQSVKIHYNGIDVVRKPAPEEMEEHFKNHLKTKGKKRHSQTATPKNYIIKFN